MKKFIILASGGIGGAEKRFFDIFKAMVDAGDNVYLVLPSCLYYLLGTNESEISSRVILIDMEVWSPIKFICKLYFTVVYKSNSTDVFHYPLNPAFFLHFYPVRKFSLSYCYCYSRPKLGWNKALSLQWLASLFASRIDILNSTIYSEFQLASLRGNRKASLTPGGTFIYPPKLELTNKELRFSFLSRMEEGKGLDVLFKVIPIIHNYYHLIGNSDVVFDIFGSGSLSAYVSDLAIDMKQKGIDVNYHGFVDSSSVFPKSKVVFSLQEKTNYPSRVVGEALINGCEVIILNSGDSKEFGQLEGLHYLCEDLSNIRDVLRTIMNSNVLKARCISNGAREKFCSQDYIDYFIHLIGNE